MKNKRHLSKSIYQTLSALLILFTIYTLVTPATALAQNSPVSKTEAANQDDAFAERFRQGRDLIDRQEWSRATDKFREAVEKYPDHKSADAALYWLAFCYKKQKKYQEADIELDRLLAKFPASTWAGDAQVMKMEIAPWLGSPQYAGLLNTDSKIKSAVGQGQLDSDLQAKLMTGTVNNSVQNKLLIDKLASADRLPLDRADEIKIAAFQSLLAADPKRAIETLGEILKPDSTAGENLKREILRVWRNPRLFASQKLTSNITKDIGSKEFVSALRETLVKSFRNERNPKIRREIIYVLANLADTQATDYLKELYATENDREVKKAIINSFGNSANMFYVLQKAEIDKSREEPRKIELDILLEITRVEKDIELRRLAFSNLRRFPNWSISDQAIDVMTQLYEAETDEEFKLSIIRAFGESKQNKASRKLMDIAKNDRSDKLRLEAIYWLREKKDPEVLKFLEDLIR